MINIVVYNVANPLQLPNKLASYMQIATLHTFIHQASYKTRNGNGNETKRNETKRNGFDYTLDYSPL